jgi:opacity protein-like surface antigen
MRMKPYLGLTLAVLFVCATYPVLAQTAPTATRNNPQFAIGAGVSGFNADWGHGIIMGETVWGDYTPTRVPLLLKGIGLEVELRDLDFGRTQTVPPLLVYQTAGGGVIYTWRRFNNIRPYGKFLEEFGGLTWRPSGPIYHHDTRNATIAGGGLEYRTWHNVWLRADYEYQFWPDLFGGKTLDPKGFTLGAMYHFNRPHFH